jgi:hypothetical protein
MNSGFSQTTPKRQLQCHCQMSPTKQQGEIQWEVPIRLIRVCSTKYLLSRCHKVRYFTSYYIKPEFKGEVWLCGWSAVFHWYLFFPPFFIAIFLLLRQNVVCTFCTSRQSFG